ncbi:MAG: hypothetical protein ACXWM7_02850 [Parachlamydiaceae bacterium]
MDVNQIYNFVFHPLLEEHSASVKTLALLTDLALTILTGGLFLIAFSFIQLRDRDIQVKKGPTPESQVATPIIETAPSVPKSSPKLKEVVIESSPSKSERVKTAQADQLKNFETWANEKNWKMFTSQYSHYDWWMFPISRSSQGQGDKYAVSEKDVQILKNDPEFMTNYLRGVELVAQSWGWDVKNAKECENLTADQKWANYKVRLIKMLESLELFGEGGYLLSMHQFVQKEGVILQ